MLTANDVAAAAVLLSGVLRATPCRRSEALSRARGAEVLLKMENLHTTGSFKERGAFCMLSSLSEEERKRGVVTASAGNHAQAVACHARRQGIAATIVMPQRTPLVKVLATQEMGGRVEQYGDSFDDAYDRALELADEHGWVFVPPFDNDRIIAGQGTLGLELLEQVPDLACVVVPIGGGGLISGIALAVKSARPEVKVIGVEAAAYPSMRTSLAAGAVVPAGGAPTLADGIAVKRVCPRTMAYVERYVDQLLTVEEEPIARAILFLLERQKTLAEGAAAATVAALLSGQVPEVKGATVAVISGGNIDPSRLDDIIVRGLAADGRRVRIKVVMPDIPGQLHRLTGVISELSINILQVAHDREFGAASLGKTMSTLTLETRGEEQIEDLLDRLSAEGFEQVERIEAAARTGGVTTIPAY